MLMALAMLLAAASVLNLAMLIWTVRRWKSTQIDPREGPVRAKIAAMTLRRAVRAEFGLLAIQVVLLSHTCYLIYVGPQHDRPFWTMVQRGFVSLVIVYTSAADFFARWRIQRLLVQLPSDGLEDAGYAAGVEDADGT